MLAQAMSFSLRRRWAIFSASGLLGVVTMTMMTGGCDHDDDVGVLHAFFTWDVEGYLRLC